MVGRLYSATLLGIQAKSVLVEVESTAGLPGYSIVGLPDSAVREARERVVSALRSSGFAAVNRRITVNLSPADLRKEGSQFDLALALGLVLASGQAEWKIESPLLIAGELSLDGSVRPVRGVLAMALLAQKSEALFLMPTENLPEAMAVPGLHVLGVSSLQESVALLTKGVSAFHFTGDGFTSPTLSDYSGLDFSQVQGLQPVRRALEIAAAGFHHFLLCGSPGTGKSLCAQCLPSILPPLSATEAIESTLLHSCAGLLKPGESLLRHRPYRSPHHGASLVALVGGGTTPRPGEISLAHNGLLFLDEFPEFSRAAIESLRQPLEAGEISVSRIRETVQWPADFLLGAAMNPCPCGYAWDSRGRCTCSAGEIVTYRKRISGPILDRIDLQIAMPTEQPNVWEFQAGESSQSIRDRVLQAHARQRKRQGSTWNARLNLQQVRDYCKPDALGEAILQQATQRLGFGSRSVLRLLKVARTISDLEGEEKIRDKHLAEAVLYRLENP